MAPKLPREFHLQNTFTVAQQLLGSYLYTGIDGQITSGKIVETEAYIGAIDKAAHSYPNKRTKRTAVQFGIGGHAYIFLIYGIYPQFCVVTGDRDICDVVLIRALEPMTGLDVMAQRRISHHQSSQRPLKTQQLTNGPGKLCVALGITTAHYGTDLCGDTIWIEAGELLPDAAITAAQRIGIDYAAEFALKPWRFYVRDSPYVSYKK